ncbi:TonB-dependent receptor [Kaistella sp. PBT33-4]|uniref:TonB-dependent receptor n=1 Tax=Kaistella sp. PBT33-4 TaxID=3032000 RepID=UPI0023D8266D|nr:TonB-dependent receptor [Kaistella sp. PBT33-4]MDF0719859.1 TonB-dependent receptor [Kaistella sp. PBT33-4]
MTKYLTLFILTIFLSKQLKAQDTLRLDTLQTLKEVVITYQADKRTPMTFQNIYSKDIKAKSTGQEPSFLLSETPSITNYSDGGNSQGYSYYRIRGIDQTRINTTFDGMPMNEPEDQGAYFSNYPDILNSVSKIQIQRGVGTTKNGVASYGGSVQLFSPNLADTTKTTFGLGYGSFNSMRVFGEYNSGIKNKKALYVRASQVYSDGYKYHSSNNSQSVFLSGGLFYDKFTWKLNFLAGNQQNDMAWIGVSDSLINIDRQTNGNHKQEKDRFFQMLTQLQNHWQINHSSSLQSSVYYTFLKGNYDFDLNNFLGMPSTNELYNYAVQSNFVGIFSNYTFSKKQFNLTSGIHGNIYNRQHTGSEKALGQLYQNTGYKNEMSFFTKADYTFKMLTFFADVQYRYVNFDYKGSVALQKLEWNFINPKAGLSVAVKPNYSLYYSLGYTGREPTRNDMFGGNDDLLADSLGNAVLFNTKPEYVLNHELGFRFKKSKLNFDVNLYYMDFKNEIVLDGKFGPNGLALTNNVEQSFRTGLELSVNYKVSKHFSLVNNSSFNYSRIKEQTETFSPILTPPIIINQEAVFSKNNFAIALSARYQHHSFIDFANEEKVNSYFLLNSRASYSIKGFQFSVFLNNITNAKYFNHGYVDFDGSKKYFVQAPTNFYASIQYSF